MGCSVSKSWEEWNDAVSICRDSKRLIKSAVERRYALADAHRKYCQSLHAVAMAIRLFVITFPPQSSGETPVFNPMRRQRKPSESKAHETIEETEVCEHFYGEAVPSIPSSQNDSGWDFFNPFDGVRTETEGLNGSDDLREAEGIPELEEEEEEEEGGYGGRAKEVDARTGGDTNVSQGENRGLGVIDSPTITTTTTTTNGRELLEALKDVECHFVRVCESGVEVSRMLETNMAHHLQSSGSQKIQDSPNKIVQPITWRRRSTSSRSSSCKSFLASSSRSSSTWTESKNDLFVEYGGMNSGSHSSTLGRLYAWEKKLYGEVKAGDHMRKIFKQKCLQLRNQDARGKGLNSVDKTLAEVIRDLYARISVTTCSVKSIYQRIQKLKDEELQPQLIELLHGLMRTWKIMLESHETQKQAMFEVKSFTCPTYGKFCNDSHRLATLQLKAELQNWRACFAEYVSAQKAYIETLDGWLSKFIALDVYFYTRGRSSVGSPLFVICHGWLTSLEKLPNKAVTNAMKNFRKDIQALCAQQGKELQQKRKVDGLEKELDKMILAFRRAEGKNLESKLSGQKTEVDVGHQAEDLAKGQLDMLRKRVDAEKLKHHDSMQETQRITLRGFQAGFSSVFESLMEFSKASLKMYADLRVKSEDGKGGNEKGEPSS